jgi:6-phosphogluconolactonase (cycloisomerase 2 family)
MVIQKSRSLVLLAALHLCLSGIALAGTPRYAFVPNIDDGTISEFIVNAATGQLLPNGYVTAGDHPRSFVQVGGFAYVANMNSNNISAYSLNQSTGHLQSLSTPTFSAPANPYALIAHPNGKFLYAVSSVGDAVYVYAIQSNGSLDEITDIATGSSPRFLAITGNGDFLYVSNYSSDNVTAYRVSATTGRLAYIGTYSTGGSTPSNVMVSNNFLYVTNAGSNNVSAFDINSSTGTLSHVSGSPFAAGDSPYSLTREYDGHFIYVANSLSNNISAFKVNAATGALTKLAGSPFAATKGTQAIKVDPSDKFLYAADAGAEEVLAYSMNTATGALTETSSIRTHGIGFDVYVSNGAAVSLEPAIAYVMNNDNDIPFNVFPLATYKMNPTTGSFASLPSSVSTADVSYISSDATGQLLYQWSSAWHYPPAYVIVCRVQPDGSCPNAVTDFSDEAFGADDPQGVYHYLAYTDPNTGLYQGLFCYEFGDTGGVFSMTQINGSPFTSPADGEPLGFDLTGKFMYDSASEILTVNPSDGALTYKGTTGSLSYSSTLHPNGRFLYSVVSGGILAEGINPVDGTLTKLSFTATSGGTPLIEQAGRFAYLYDGKKVNLYRINPTTGTLTTLSSPLTTSASVQIDATKNFLYLLSNGTMNSGGASLTPTVIAAYKINHTTGALTHTASISFPTLSSTGYSLATTSVLK